MLFEFTAEPTGKAYRTLLQMCLETNDRFELTSYNDCKDIYTTRYHQVMAALAPDLINSKAGHANALNTMGGWHTLVLYRYQANSVTGRVLKRATTSLYDWGRYASDKLPDDLTFYQAGVPTLMVLGHEEYACMRTQTKKDRKRLLAIPDLELAPREDWLDD